MIKKIQKLINIGYKKTWFVISFLFLLGLFFQLFIRGLIQPLFVDFDLSWSVRSLGLLMAIGSLYFFNKYRKDDLNAALFFLFLTGFFLRLGYVFTNELFERQYDVGQINLHSINSNAVGHFAYILNLFELNSLPNSNAYQFYHPPLHHFLSAVWMRGYALLVPNSSWDTLLHSIQVLTLFYSTMLMVVTSQIAKTMKLKNNENYVLTAFVGLHPSLILLSGRLNNDALSVLWIFLIILLTFRWQNTKRITDIVLLAFAIGLGMMTKMSVITMTPWVALIFLYVLIEKYIKREKIGSLITQFSLFALIVFPLGLWYPIRNLILFNQPFNFVYLLPEYYGVSEFSLWNRFIFINVEELTRSLFANSSVDSNMWSYLFKTSVFAEYSYWGSFLLAIGMLLSNVILFFLFIPGLCIETFLAFQKRKFFDIAMVGILIFNFSFFIYFNLQYPFGPTYDFRYLVPVLIPLGFFLIKWISYSSSNQWVTTYSVVMKLAASTFMFFAFFLFTFIF